MTQSSAAITARELRKSFGEHTVLDDVDLEVDQGTIFALLGPNGAGKTTIVRILSTLLKPDAGTATVAGFVGLGTLGVFIYSATGTQRYDVMAGASIAVITLVLLVETMFAIVQRAVVSEGVRARTPRRFRRAATVPTAAGAPATPPPRCSSPAASARRPTHWWAPSRCRRCAASTSTPSSWACTAWTCAPASGEECACSHWSRLATARWVSTTPGPFASNAMAVSCVPGLTTSGAA